MNVVQRIGPTTQPRTAVAPFEDRAVSTEGEAAVLRRRFRRWVGTITDADTADDLTLAVYEALANVVDHAYHDADGPGPMQLWAAASAPLCDGRELVVTVTDRGAWRPGRDAGWRGRGLALVRSLTTAAAVLVSESGTTVQMRCRVAPHSAGLPALASA